MNQRNDYPGFWHAVLLCFIFVVLQNALIMQVAIADVAFKLQLTRHPIILGAINLAACAAVLVVGWLIGRPTMSEVWTLRRVSPLASVAVVFASGGALILLSEADNLVRIVLPPPEWIVSLFAELSFASEHPWASLFALVIVAPVTEELMFRGLILRGFLRRFSTVRAFLWSSILFGFVHLNPWQFISATGLGLLFAWWYARTQSLIPSLIGHALVNGLFAFNSSLPFEVQGFNAGDPLSGTELQPLWFDALGILLLAAGLWLFHCATPPLKASFQSSTGPPPLGPTTPPIIPSCGAPPNP